MPRKYKTKIKSRRRPRQKKRAVSRPMRMPLGGFPNHKKVRLRYTEVVALNPGATEAQNVFRANSVFDPNLTGAGHQPLYYDVWSGLYSHYTVLGSKIVATRCLNTTTDPTPLVYGIHLGIGSTSTVAMTAEELIEQKNNNRWINAGSPSLSGKNLRLAQYFSPRKFFGVKDPEDDDGSTALVTANPTRDAYFSLWARPIGGATSTAQQFIVEIEYLVSFSELKIQSSS